jgi:hypothetical protein
MWFARAEIHADGVTFNGGLSLAVNHCQAISSVLRGAGTRLKKKDVVVLLVAHTQSQLQNFMPAPRRADEKERTTNGDNDTGRI